MLTKLAFLSLIPTFVHALVGISWSVSGGPSSGLTDITFPINMANATHVSGYYYAMQFAFAGLDPGPDGTSNIGYTGLQPRPDSNGQSIVHAAFSSFVANTTTTDPNCTPGADGGPGVSCSVDVASSYDHTYNLLVENTSGTTWVGTLIDTVTGARTQVGSWTLPSGASGIGSSQVGFIEYYLWNDGQNHPCNTLPWTQVFFGTPTTSASGAVLRLGTAYEYGNCVGQVDFQTSSTSAGSTTSVGFHNASVDASSEISNQVVLS